MSVQNIPFPAESLRHWFSLHKRELPWRKDPTPYAVWVSEIMLQQTQVSVVIDYYRRWMQRFPTIEALAQGTLEEVIKQWEGLGYYSRARHLHESAQFLVEQHGGQLPNERAALARVKGLGPYTIGAILSFAFRQKAAAVDGNAIRVLSRYFAVDEDVDQARVKKMLWQLAEDILPDRAPWEIVEGLIELGATLCKKEPLCMQCPLQKECRAVAWGVQNQLPKKSKKVEILKISRKVFIIYSKECVLVKKTEEKKVMADLYEFPYGEKDAEFPFAIDAVFVHELPQLTHSFTRYRATLFPSVWQTAEAVEVPGFVWVPKEKLKEYPFSSGHRKILECLR
jgi:A/G-specific adenine glycosylase